MSKHNVSHVSNNYIFIKNEHFSTSLSQFHFIVQWVYIHGFNGSISLNGHIQCVHITDELFLWAKLLHAIFFFPFFFFALWWICLKGIFFTNKGFDASSFLCETGVVLFPEESCTVKTSLVVTHSCIYFFLNHCITQTEFCWPCL